MRHTYISLPALLQSHSAPPSLSCLTEPDSWSGGWRQAEGVKLELEVVFYGNSERKKKLIVCTEICSMVVFELRETRRKLHIMVSCFCTDPLLSNLIGSNSLLRVYVSGRFGLNIRGPLLGREHRALGALHQRISSLELTGKNCQLNFIPCKLSPDWWDDFQWSWRSRGLRNLMKITEVEKSHF